MWIGMITSVAKILSRYRGSDISDCFTTTRLSRRVLNSKTIALSSQSEVLVLTIFPLLVRPPNQSRASIRISIVDNESLTITKVSFTIKLKTFFVSICSRRRKIWARAICFSTTNNLLLCAAFEFYEFKRKTAPSIKYKVKS